jgi:CBS domain-containing protein
MCVGIAFEVLFYGHRIGISFPIWVALAVVALVTAALVESVPVRLANLWPAIPIVFLAAMASVRLEPLTVFLDFVLTLALLALWVRSFRAGMLAGYGWLDFGLALTWVPIESFVRPWPTLDVVQRRLIAGRGGRSGIFAVLRGALLAIPILAVFVILLSAADLVFGEYVGIALRWFDLTRLADWAGRGLVILFASVFSLGAIIAALRDASDRSLMADRGPLVQPFLGFTESAIVLASVDVLFALFVVVQIAYFFGGEANVTTAGFTYSEYARRGFGELVAVGFLSLGLIMTMASVARRETARKLNAFNVLSACLVVLVGVILASALKRLLLYEQAYGFTRLRTYTHVAIVWMALVFLAFLLLLLRGSLRRFAPVSAVAIFGFAATLNLLNVDAFIVERNVTRLQSTGELDIPYLAGLSEDALPGLANLAIDGPQGQRDLLLPELACWDRQLDDLREELGWQSRNFGRDAGAAALSRIAPLLSGYQVEQDSGLWKIGAGSDRQVCIHQPWGMRQD